MQVAGVVAVAAMGTLAADRSRALREGGASVVASLSGSYSLGFAVAAGCGVAAILVTLVALRGPRGG
ncbi:MAG TPA: hypothetical protein VIA06_11410 [Candidatus Dormibacteraeota bacterium]|jgi:hypothetical protein|nr:hypothetical protein [Candidatus Dormibacteraeota bacterium]